MDDLTVTLRCRGPSEEPRDVDDLVDHLVVGNKLNDRPGPEVEGHWEGKPPVGKVVADHTVSAARQAGGQGAHHLPGGGGGQVVRGGGSQLVGQQLLLPQASHLIALAHDTFHLIFNESQRSLFQILKHTIPVTNQMILLANTRERGQDQVVWWWCDHPHPTTDRAAAAG